MQTPAIFAFDKGMSMFPLCLGSGGTHYNLGNADRLAGGLAFAPLLRIDSEAERAWAEEWIASLMELQHITVMPMHRNAIHAAMLDLSAQPDNLRSLTSFFHIVQDHQIKDATSTIPRKVQWAAAGCGHGRSDAFAVHGL